MTKHGKFLEQQWLNYTAKFRDLADPDQIDCMEDAFEAGIVAATRLFILLGKRKRPRDWSGVSDE